MNYKGFVSPLVHWHYETFRAAAGDFAGQRLTFQTNASGRVTSVSAALEPAVKDIVFERRPAPRGPGDR